MNVRHWIGNRIIKTCLAALITAYICEWLHWPPMFAVVAAIVSIEPTSADSIKKGLIRFPASAIGAAYAMFFEFILQEHAITYTLAACLTLITCHILKLHVGMIVAVLTAVAMIPETYGNYLDSFMIRLATTLTGITVATLINYFILPPKYLQMIQQSIKTIYHETGDILNRYFTNELGQGEQTMTKYQNLNHDLERAFRLVRYQQNETRFHRRSIEELHTLNRDQRILEQLQKVMYHLGNMIYIDLPEDAYTESEKALIKKVGCSLGEIYQNLGEGISDKHYVLVEQLDDLFVHIREHENCTQSDLYRHHFSERLVLLYELLSLHDVIEELQNKAQKHRNS